MRRLSASICAVLIGWALIWIFVGIGAPTPPIVKEEFAEQFFSTCRVETSNGTGTGILLDTGFILTAAHVVDLNSSGSIDKDERETKVTFFTDKISRTIKARAISCGPSFLLDVAILEPNPKMRSKIKLTLNEAIIGDELFNIGCQNGLPPHLSFGHESREMDLFTARTTLNAYTGSSGSAVFNEDGEVIGILDAVGVDIQHLHSKVPYRYKGKKRVLTGHINYTHILPGWSTYVRSTDAYSYYSAKGLGSTLILEPVERDYGGLLIYLKMGFQIIGVLACVVFLRKEILG